MLVATDPHAHLKDRDLYERFYSVDTRPNTLTLIDDREPRFAFARHHIRPRDRVLDVGCYKGEITIPLAMMTKAVFIGLDVGQFAVDQANAAARALKVMAKFEKGWAENLPYSDNTFDVVMLLEILEHVPDTDIVIAEAERVVRDGGTIIVSSPQRAIEIEQEGDDHVPGFEHLVGHVREFVPRQELAGKDALLCFDSSEDESPFTVGESGRGIGFYLAAYRVGKGVYVKHGERMVVDGEVRSKSLAGR